MKLDKRFRPRLVLGAILGIVGFFYIGTYIALRSFEPGSDYVAIEYEIYPSRTVFVERPTSVPSGYGSYHLRSSRNKKHLGVTICTDSAAPWATKIFLPIEAIELHIRKRL